VDATLPAAGSETQDEFRHKVRGFLARHARPRREADPWSVAVHGSAEEVRATFDRGVAWQGLLFEHRLAGLTVPAELGGRGGTAWHERIYREEARAYDGGSGFVGSTIAYLVPVLLRYGTRAQQEQFIPRLLSAEYTFCQLLSEPGAGSDLAGLACRAVRDGDDFVVNGQKVWNSYAQFCTWGMLLVRTDPRAPKHRGITFLLVPMASRGMHVRPLVQATGAAQFNEVFLDGVRVPVANALGDVDGGWPPARVVLTAESSYIGEGGTGSLFERLVTLARDYGQVSEPMVRQRLAGFYACERLQSLTAARIMTAVREGKAPPVDPLIMKLAMAINRAAFADLAGALMGADAIANGGTRGAYVRFELMNRYSYSIGGGTNEVQRNNLAERSLDLPREPGTDRTTRWYDNAGDCVHRPEE
jgi:alkylation response protein AidB-like acyl-CoA dehydrogenase